MRSCLTLLLVLGACDLKPPPKQPPATADAIEDAGAGAMATPPEPAGDAGGPRAPADAMIEVTQPCLAVAVKIADVLIASMTDPAQKAALEQDRTKLVRRTAEGCTRDAWSEPARACFLKATTREQLQLCGRNLQAP